MKPSFLIAGIMKSGTTYLDNLVRSHPEIYMPRRSMDYSYFDNDEIFKKGWSWYEGIFRPSANNLVIGQTSADCAFNRGTLERIKEALPDVILIFVVRHPVHRAYSLYWHQVMMGREYLSFEDAIDRESTRVRRSYYDYKMYSYLERSRYKSQFEKVYSLFPKDQVIAIAFEDLIKNEVSCLNRIFNRIGVSSIADLSELKLEFLSKNPAKIPTNMNVVRVSAALQRMGLVRAGRWFLNRFLVERRPPLMAKETENYLNERLKEDIEFHQSLLGGIL